MIKMGFWQDKRVVITGGAGFLGRYVVKLLEEKRVRELFIPCFHEYDLRKKEVCEEVVKDKDIVIHLAANVGGIGYNLENPGTLFYDNLVMGVQLIEAARLASVTKFVIVSSICAYPKFTPVPFKEEFLWDGYPDETTAPYGLAKRMLSVQSAAYRKQYNFNSIVLLLANLYGPGDNFNPERSHAIPALIKRCIEAEEKKFNTITCWGDGSASREFLYVKDAAKAIVLAAESYNQSEPINVGNGREIEMKDLVKQICLATGFSGKVLWDKSKPNGQPRRGVDTSKAEILFGFKAPTSFEDGLNKTIQWYKNEREKAD